MWENLREKCIARKAKMKGKRQIGAKLCEIFEETIYIYMHFLSISHTGISVPEGVYK